MKKIITKKSQSQQLKSPLGMSEENFKIYLRIKPIIEQQCTTKTLKIHNTNKVEIISPYYSVSQAQKMFSFQQIFDGEVNNNEVFNRTMITAIQNVMNGYNSTVFIYGMTGAGKTYTMFGSASTGTSARVKCSEQGLVPMTIDYIFKQIEKENSVKSQINVSFYQIYNQNIRDLLQEDHNSLTIMEDPIHGVFINGLTEIAAEDKNHIKDIILSGIDKRSMNSTKSNEVSSRSHAILQLTVKRYVNDVMTGQISVLQSKFFMIDLAGNEKTYQNQSRRFIEGVNINKSLLTLGKCLSVLAQKKGAYVPFRDSKLTRILKQSLGGNSKTVMIACVSPDKKFYEQTLNTLKYSSLAKKIKNKGVKHNVRILLKDQLRQLNNYVKPKQVLKQKKVYDPKIATIIKQFMAAIEAKTKLQKIQQDLQINLRQNQQFLKSEECDIESCHRNINMINDMLKQLMRPYEKEIERLNKTYHDMLLFIQEEIHRHNKENSLNSQNQTQIIRLKNTIAEQNKKIEQYSQLLDSMNGKNQRVHHISINQVTPSQRSINASPQFHKQKSLPTLHIPIVEIGKKSQRTKKLTLNFLQQNYQTGALKSLDMSNLSLSSSHDKRIKPQKQIVINLNAGKIDSKQNQSGREDFLKRLKQTQKKAKIVQSHQINTLLQEQQIHQYELGNIQLSMIRKLKFFQREKSKQKANSLNKITVKGPNPSKSIFRKF